jgi:hypothetical protein
MVQVSTHARRNRGFGIALIAFGVSFVATAAPQSDSTTGPASTNAAPPNSPATDVAQPKDAPAAPATLTPAPSAPAPEPTASAPAAAPTTLSAPVTVKTIEEPKPKPWHGSAISYGAFASAMTFAPNGQPYYDPTAGHQVTLLPEWHFNDLFYTRARMFISQELTLSDTTNSKYEIELSDIYWDTGWTGWTESRTGIKISADVRLTLPTSKNTQYKTQVLNVGPGVSVSRKFNLLSGLAIGYGARPTFHFNQHTTYTALYDPLTECIDTQSASCAFDRNSGSRNVMFDIGHGPFLSFQPYETVSLDAAFIMSRGWLYPLAQVPGQFAGSTQLGFLGTDTRDVTRFFLSVSWQFTKAVGVSLTALTIGGQLAADGTYIFPLFNRNTQMYLDFTLDVETVTNRLIKS